jgi:hypothetical protein
MEIVLIYWKIKPDQEAHFLEFWEKKLKIRDKSGLIAEYLSKVNDPKTDRERQWFTWKLFRGDVVTYVNVGLWRSKDDFLDETERYRSDDYEFKHEMAEIKAEDTERAWLKAALARIGTYKITPEELKTVT